MTKTFVLCLVLIVSLAADSFSQSEAVSRENVDAILCVENSEIHSKFEFYPAERVRRRILELLKAKKVESGLIVEITELRDAPGFVGETQKAVVGKILQTGDEVFVITLTKEVDEYFFGGINSPSTDDFNKLKLLWRKP